MRRTPGVILAISFAALPAFTEEGRRAAIVFDELPGAQMLASERCDAGTLDQQNRDLAGSVRRNRIPATALIVAGRCPENPQDVQNALELWDRSGLTARDRSSAPSIPVTVAVRDDLYAIAYRHALAQRNMPLARRIADDYLRYLDSALDFYERLSAETLGYELPQILSLHDSRLNADQFDRVAAMMRRRGYRFIPVADALKDEAYRRAPLPGNGSILERWAARDPKKTLTPPSPPPWLEALVTGTDAR